MSPHCQNCGNHVSEDYVRVMSPDGQSVISCPANDCDNVRSRREVREQRSGHGSTEPTKYDPAVMASD